MKILIENLRVSDGYNSDWGEVNRKSLAVGQDDNWPRSEIYFTNEECKDTSPHAQAYTNYITCEIHVFGKLDFSSDNPQFDINDIHDEALDDLKKLFGTNDSVNDSCIDIMYVSAKPKSTDTKDQFIPERLITTWRIEYTQDRLDPTIGTSS
jgi:hypothetical protein